MKKSEYMIVNKKDNHVVNRFSIDWLLKYKKLEKSWVCPIKMVEYCRKEIQEIEEYLAFIHPKLRFCGMKEEIIENLKCSSNTNELYDVLLQSIKLLNKDKYEQEVSYYENILKNFRQLENKIIYYVILDEDLFDGKVSL